jgi:hypothetical protein
MTEAILADGVVAVGKFDIFREFFEADAAFNRGHSRNF